MDVTSRELREGNIRDALRGYNHDDVDELLERAAATIDGLQTRVRELTERLQQTEGEASRGRETEDMLQRTLLVAQRTADEVVAEARESAQKILDEAEEQATSVVSEAERSAKAEVEEDARRLKAEVLELAAAREALDADVIALTTFAEQLGARLRDALEAQIAALESGSIDITDRPVLAEVEIPTPDEGIAPTRTASPADSSMPSSGVAASGVAAAGEDPAPETAEIGTVEEFDEVVHPNPEGDEVDEPVAVSEPDEGRHSALLDERFGLGPARPIESRGKDFDTGEVLEGEVLDDETFFASLRDAVRDESPLGPRDDELGPPEKHGDIFDQDEADESGRGIFRRKR